MNLSRTIAGADQRGFTLIELLVVVAVVAVLSAVAIPQFASFRRTGHDALAVSDLRNAATAEEAAYAVNQVYRVCVSGGCNDPSLPGFQKSGPVELIMIPILTAGGDDAFVGIAWSNRGTGRVYAWRSDEGGLL